MKTRQHHYQQQLAPPTPPPPPPPAAAAAAAAATTVPTRKVLVPHFALKIVSLGEEGIHPRESDQGGEGGIGLAVFLWRRVAVGKELLQNKTSTSHNLYIYILRKSILYQNEED